VLTRRFAFLMVVSTRPGSPAARADLRPGDVIKTVDGRHTRPISVPLGSQLLRGEPGSTVKLEILRSGNEPIDVPLVRERLASAPPSTEKLSGGHGLIRVAEFSGQTPEQVAGEIGVLRLQGASSLILDLRGAAYGPLDAGIEVAGLFMKGGLVARLVGRSSAEQAFEASPTSAWDGPLAVLVDRGTAGAAEIVAAALQDSGRAHVVGEQTFGIAPHQQAFPIEGGGLVLTVAKYVSPSGEPIHQRGVVPGVPVAVPEEPADGVDPILDRALSVLDEAAGAAEAA
jgi:carboxyl-terminal processing protease